MNHFTVIYKILRALETRMETGAFDADRIAPETLHVTQAHRDALLCMLYENGYIDGICVNL